MKTLPVPNNCVSYFIYIYYTVGTQTARWSHLYGDEHFSSRLTKEPVPSQSAHFTLEATGQNMLTLWSLLLYTFIPLIQCTGYLELRLTSPYVRVLNVSVELAIGSEKSFYKVPLSPYYELAITNVPIEFDQPASIIIRSGPVKEIGLTDFVVSPKIFSTRKMSIVPPKAGLPFSGFRIDIKCDT